jgi:membrane protein required for colicin V production
MTGLDIVVLLIVGLGAITGFMRGFVEETLALSAWICAIFAIRYLHTPLTNAIAPHLDFNNGAPVLAFALLLLVPYAVVKLIANQFGKATRASALGPFDRLLGFGFGTVKGVVITVFAFSVLVLGYDTVWGVGGRPDWVTQARSYTFINSASQSLVELIAERRQALQERRTDAAEDTATDGAN